MRGGLRLTIAVAAAGLALAPMAALAQDVPPATTNAPATETVGPRELQNFNLGGTVTRPAEPQPARTTTAPAARAPSEARTASTADQGASSAPRQAPSVETGRPTRTSATEAQPTREPRQTAPSSATVAQADLASAPAAPGDATPIPASASGFAPEPDAGTLAPEHGFSLLPWLLAAIALGAGGAFLFWRNRSRHAYAGGPEFDAFVAPEPAYPEPRAPAPAPPKTPPPLSGGIVSTRLRPWLDLTMQPVRCILEDHQVTIEFDLELFNSGSTPARAVLVEAMLFNASGHQDQEIGAFFASPVGQGERIASIAPLKRVNLRTQVVTPREHIQILQAGERHVFVPLLAFNALYRWSNGEGQTSASYLVARDTQGEKMAPFRADLGPRVFRGVGARLLPLGVRN